MKFTKDLPVKTLTSSKSINKIDKDNSQSKAVSFHIELKDSSRLKIMFDNELEIEDWLKSLDSILDLVISHYENFPNDKLSKKLENLNQKSNYEIFAIINKQSKQWEFLDFQMILKSERKNDLN